jgi:L-amino acid N-acyltransferase YncA
MTNETIEFENINISHQGEIMEIFNYYIENSYSAYPDKSLHIEFFNSLLKITKGYPAFVMKCNQKVIGFCMLRAYNPFPVFDETAEISYFIDKDYSGHGIGKIALSKIEEEAKKKGIKIILASISSLNTHSLSFHKKKGFVECGRFLEIGKKFGKSFDVIWMEKKIINAL